MMMTRGLLNTIQCEDNTSGDRMAEKKKWIQEAIKKPGALRKALHVKEDEKIPASKLKKAEHSKSPTMRKRAVLAETLRKMRKK